MSENRMIARYIARHRRPKSDVYNPPRCDTCGELVPHHRPTCQQRWPNEQVPAPPPPRPDEHLIGLIEKPSARPWWRLWCAK